MTGNPSPPSGPPARAGRATARSSNAGRDRQGGWAGMLVLLLALVIVAWLARDALTKYGLVPDAATVAPPAATGARTGGAAGSVDGADPGAAKPAPRTPMDAARGVESTLKEQEGKRDGGY